jgi:tetratricopeptide (TPR) repeat protein/TolB-like protein
MRLAPGVHLGAYEILAPLGGGGMGEVYRARESALGRHVAIKVLPSEVANDAERLARFTSEARLASSLNHPNIITIFGVGDSAGVRYIAMELVEGQTLKQLRAQGPVAINFLVDIAAQVAAGLCKAHEAGIVHRDLKPRNVMVTGDGLVKILDFGLSKLLAPDNADDDTRALPTEFGTAPGALLGTTDYMSPEQAAGRPVDARSDQFSLGTMLYEITAGKHPFHRPTRVQTLGAIIGEEPEPLSRAAPSTPAIFRAVIERCLKKDPQQRFTSTRELVDELRRVQASLSGGVGYWLRRYATAAAAVIAVVAALAAAYVGLDYFATPSVSPLQNQELAVLPFTNVGGDASNQAFSDGLVETLTSKLTQLEQSERGFWVVPATEVRREGVTSVRDAQRAFAATLAITGSVQRSTDRLRLTVNLVDARTLRQIHARTIDVDSRDVTAIQDGVVMQVFALLGADVGKETREQLVAGGTVAPGAYDYYLQGRGYLQRFEKLENVDSAIDLFTRALGRDGEFALAYAGLGEAYWRRYEATHDAQLVQKAREACSRALKLSDRLAQVHVTLGIVDRGTGEYEAAVRELRQALAIDSVSGDALRELGRTYEALGDLASAESTYQQAIKVRPGDWTNHNDLGRFYFARGRYADAVRAFQQVVNLTPDNPRGYSNLGAAFAQLQLSNEAIDAFQKSVSLRPTEGAYSNLGTIFFREKRYTEAARMFERAVDLNKTNYRMWRNLGMAYHWAPGERGKAAAAFERVAALAEEERKVNPRRPALLVDLASAYARLGQTSRARDLAHDAEALGSLDGGVTYNLAAVYEDIGDRTKALDMVRAALKLGYPREQVEQSPSLAELRMDPRYASVLQP